MAADRDKAAKLIRMLSSANEGEVLNVARALARVGIHEVAALVERPDLAPGLATCAWCGEAFSAYRSDAKACSPRCRTALYRARQSGDR